MKMDLVYRKTVHPGFRIGQPLENSSTFLPDPFIQITLLQYFQDIA